MISPRIRAVAKRPNREQSSGYSRDTLSPFALDSVTMSSLLDRWKQPLRYVMGSSYILAGILHFVGQEQFERVVPPQFPRPGTLVTLSGIAEVVLGTGVLFERTRRPSAWGLVALLVAVFPANVYMATGDDFDPAELPAELRNPRDAALWARLPLQAVLVAWALWYTDEPSGSD